MRPRDADFNVRVTSYATNGTKTRCNKITKQTFAPGQLGLLPKTPSTGVKWFRFYLPAHELVAREPEEGEDDSVATAADDENSDEYLVGSSSNSGQFSPRAVLCAEALGFVWWYAPEEDITPDIACRLVGVSGDTFTKDDDFLPDSLKERLATAPDDKKYKSFYMTKTLPLPWEQNAPKGLLDENSVSVAEDVYGKFGAFFVTIAQQHDPAVQRDVLACAAMKPKFAGRSRTRTVTESFFLPVIIINDKNLDRFKAALASLSCRLTGKEAARTPTIDNDTPSSAESTRRTNGAPPEDDDDATGLGTAVDRGQAAAAEDGPERRNVTPPTRTIFTTAARPLGGDDDATHASSMAALASTPSDIRNAKILIALALRNRDGTFEAPTIAETVGELLLQTNTTVVNELLPGERQCAHDLLTKSPYYYKLMAMPANWTVFQTISFFNMRINIRVSLTLILHPSLLSFSFSHPKPPQPVQTAQDILSKIGVNIYWFFSLEPDAPEHEYSTATETSNRELQAMLGESRENQDRVSLTTNINKRLTAFTSAMTAISNFIAECGFFCVWTDTSGMPFFPGLALQLQQCCLEPAARMFLMRTQATKPQNIFFVVATLEQILIGMGELSKNPQAIQCVIRQDWAGFTAIAAPIVAKTEGIVTTNINRIQMAARGVDTLPDVALYGLSAQKAALDRALAAAARESTRSDVAHALRTAAPSRDPAKRVAEAALSRRELKQARLSNVDTTGDIIIKPGSELTVLPTPAITDPEDAICAAFLRHGKACSKGANCPRPHKKIDETSKQSQLEYCVFINSQPDCYFNTNTVKSAIKYMKLTKSPDDGDQKSAAAGKKKKEKE